MKKLKSFTVILALSALPLVFIMAGDNYFEISKNLDIFASLYREINTNYVDDVKPGDLMKTGIEAMLATLDPYTNYIPESQIEDFRFMTTGQYGGIGALILKRDEDIVVTETYDDFPAQKAGILIGDVIVEIDGKSVAGKSTPEISEFLKGQPESAVNVKIKRGLGKDVKLIDKKLVRAEIKIHDVPYYAMLNPDVGYIKLTGFTPTASTEFMNALKLLKEKRKMKALIVDLRGNGGGLLREAVSIVNFFVEWGTPVVSTKGKLKEWDQPYKAENNPYDTELPLVIIVDENSASASEIVAGSLQDLDRAVILGEETFGKGLVQQTVDLSYNSKLKVTVAKYYTPSGRCIQKLNYASRNEEGKAEEIPDSLIREFKSLKYGRSLYDGKGIKPDVEVKENRMSNISNGLIDEYLFFDFATDFRIKTVQIDSVRNFELSDEIMNRFRDFVNSRNFKYSTNAEKLLSELKVSTEKEHYYKDVENEYNALSQRLQEVKNNDFDKHVEEIEFILSRELVQRYYHQKGQLEFMLKGDSAVSEGMAILADNKRYQSIFRNTNKAGK